MRTLGYLAHDETHRFSLASFVTLNDFYVDDVLYGAEDKQTALVSQQKLRKVTQAGGFTQIGSGCPSAQV